MDEGSIPQRAFVTIEYNLVVTFTIDLPEDYPMEEAHEIARQIPLGLMVHVKEDDIEDGCRVIDSQAIKLEPSGAPILTHWWETNNDWDESSIFFLGENVDEFNSVFSGENEDIEELHLDRETNTMKTVKSPVETVIGVSITPKAEGADMSFFGPFNNLADMEEFADFHEIHLSPEYPNPRNSAPEEWILE